MENNYRIHTNIISDTVLKVNLQQDFDFLEILSLKMSQEGVYNFKSSSHGVLIGRVLANDAFGIPNAKVSVFIPISDGDTQNSEIFSIYNYSKVTDTVSNIRYNLLPDDYDDKCYKVVGTFPNKRLVLDDSTVLEIYDKYYKYTTVTNNSGDYMFYGIPTGDTKVHVDIDLSDVGILSQKPRDFMYKGYAATNFDSSEQFKSSTNLDNLAQIISQNQGCYVYPFLGEEGSEDVAITRCDIQVQYKFEPTCVFMGSIITDSYGNNIGPTCFSTDHAGKIERMVSNNGTIEMIRKTVDGLVEDFQIQGNQLIDADGVWCYQIPMNLDYVGTDEYGNICATDDPSKGIPTRTRVRFRISVNEASSDEVNRHRAKFLVPNNPKFVENSIEPMISHPNEFDKHFNFGTTTLDEDYRDLYWNKVYSIKSYIPRLQLKKAVSTTNYSGVRTNNLYGDNNPFPFNKIRFRLPFSYILLCVITKIVIRIIQLINYIICSLATALAHLICIYIPFFGWWCPFEDVVCRIFSLIPFGAGLVESDDKDVMYIPGGCQSFCATISCLMDNTACSEEFEDGCERSCSTDDLFDVVEESLALDYNIFHLDFYNDWVNGTLYFPLFQWRKSKAKTFNEGGKRKKIKNHFCDCDVPNSTLRVVDTCTIDEQGDPSWDEAKHWLRISTSVTTTYGIIKNVVNKDDLNIYYYTPGNIRAENRNVTTDLPYVRLFATDIILLGTFNTCDLDGVPQPFESLPSTTSYIPNIVRVTVPLEENILSVEGTSEEGEVMVQVNGMDWRSSGRYNEGLIFGIDCTAAYGLPKSCMNIQRMSELGVNVDMSSKGNKIDNTEYSQDGFISKLELDDGEARAMFATMNHNGLDVQKVDLSTGYKVYDYKYVFPVDFDGRLKKQMANEPMAETTDAVDSDYNLFRYGNVSNAAKKYYFGQENGSNTFMPIYNNSFYFYFGLKNGKTAIDKFRTMFTTTCYKSHISPFTIKANKVLPASVTLSQDSDFYTDPKTAKKNGVIDIQLLDIQQPYSYTLKDSVRDIILISEDNVSTTQLMFGIKMIDKYSYASGSTTGPYYENTNGIYEKNGLVYQVNNGTDFVWMDREDEEDIKVEISSSQPGANFKRYILEPTIYTITITDVNGKTLTEKIDLRQSEIYAEINSANLGERFVLKENANVQNFSTEQTLYDHFSFGEINISAITIDSIPHKIISQNYVGFTDKVPKSDNLFARYNLTVQSLEDNETTYDVTMDIGVYACNIEEDVRFQNGGQYKPNGFIFDGGQSNTTDFITNNSNIGDEPAFGKIFEYTDFSGNTIPITGFSYHVWVPSIEVLKLTQLWKRKPIDNTSTVNIKIGNGTLFDVTVNTLPIRFLKGFNDKKCFYHENITSLGDCLANNDGYGLLFDALNSESSLYQFPKLEEDSKLWENYINVAIDEDNFGRKYYILETKFNHFAFKMRAILKFANGVYYTDTGSKFEFVIKGGKNVAFQTYGVTPIRKALEFDVEGSSYDFILDNNVSNSYFVSTRDKTFVFDYRPCVIGPNYKVFNENKAQFEPLTTKTGRTFNPLRNIKKGSESEIANSVFYFVAATNNGNLNNNTRYEVIPKDCKLLTDFSQKKLYSFANEPMPPSNFKAWNGDQNILKWFKLVNIDMRISYLMTFVSGNGIDKKGRYLLKTTNGVRLAYDENDNYNILERVDGDTPKQNLQYYYKQNELTSNTISEVKLYYNQNSTKRLFKASIFEDQDEDSSIDLRDALKKPTSDISYPCTAFTFGSLSGSYLPNYVTLQLESCKLNPQVKMELDGEKLERIDDDMTLKSRIQTSSDISRTFTTKVIEFANQSVDEMIQRRMGHLLVNSGGDVIGANIPFNCTYDSYNSTDAYDFNMLKMPLIFIGNRSTIDSTIDNALKDVKNAGDVYKYLYQKKTSLAICETEDYDYFKKVMKHPNIEGLYNNAFFMDRDGRCINKDTIFFSTDDEAVTQVVMSAFTSSLIFTCGKSGKIQTVGDKTKIITTEFAPVSKGLSLMIIGSRDYCNDSTQDVLETKNELIDINKTFDFDFSYNISVESKAVKYGSTVTVNLTISKNGTNVSNIKGLFLKSGDIKSNSSSYSNGKLTFNCEPFKVYWYDYNSFSCELYYIDPDNKLICKTEKIKLELEIEEYPPEDETDSND